MKRPRANQRKSSEEQALFLSCFEDRSTIVASSGGMASSESPRTWNSCHSRNSCRSRRRRSSSSTSLLVGSCLVATLMLGLVSLGILPMIDASISMSTNNADGIHILPTMTMTTTTMTDPDYNQKQNVRERRIEQQEHRVLRQNKKKKKKKEPRQEQQKESPSSSTADFSTESASSSTSSPLSTSPQEECIKPAGKCMQCTFTEQKTYDACRETGRWQRFECVLAETAEQESTDLDIRIEMKSCKYTDFDEGFAMLQLQIFCLLIGSLAIISVKKQKRLSTNMFDQRKQQGAAANNNMSRSSLGSSKMRANDCVSEHDNEIEFTPMTNQQKEKVPLMEIDADHHMEII